MSSILIPPGAMSQEEDYERYLLAGVRAWQSVIVPIIKDRLNLFFDSWISDLADVLKETWNEEAYRLSEKAKTIMENVSTTHRGWWKRAISKVTGVKVETADTLIEDLWMPEELQGRMRENIALIKDIGDKAADQIERVLRDGLRDGITRKEMAKQIQGILDSTEQRARTIARDQVQKHYSAVNELRQKDAGIEGYFWDHSHDSVVRKEHRKRGGVFFLWKSPPPDGHPGQPVNCRCTARPRLPKEIYGIPVKERYRDKDAA